MVRSCLGHGCGSALVRLGDRRRVWLPALDPGLHDVACTGEQSHLSGHLHFARLIRPRGLQISPSLAVPSVDPPTYANPLFSPALNPSEPVPLASMHPSDRLLLDPPSITPISHATQAAAGASSSRVAAGSLKQTLHKPDVTWLRNTSYLQARSGSGSGAGQEGRRRLGPAGSEDMGWVVVGEVVWGRG